MTRDEESGVPLAAIVIVGSILFLLVVGTLIWFALPGISAKHHFVSPSGRITLDVGEQCDGETCDRRIIAETTAPDGSKSRRGCSFDLAPIHPVLLNAYLLWAADEQTIVIVYADGDGQGGKLPLDIATDCTTME